MNHQTKKYTGKAIVLGLNIGLGLGLPLAALILVISAPWNQTPPVCPTPVPPADTSAPALPSPTTSPVSATEIPVTPTPEPSVTPSPTYTPLAITQTIMHIVAPGEMLTAIALEYGVSVEDILKANQVENPDSIWPGETIVIPKTDEEPPSDSSSPTVNATQTPTEPWEFSIIEGNLAAGYPETAETSRFTIHYKPGTYPEDDIKNVESMLIGGLAHIEQTLQAQLDGSFDVYVAGSVFQSPNQALRGRSFSAARRYFFLHDGTGNQADQQYIATHEMTHLFTWNTFGRPVSAMLSEGIAVHTGMTLIHDSDHIPIQTFCKAYRQAGKLPRISSSLSFSGHIRDLENYYAAGCFVQYLVGTYGPEAFGILYPTGNYVNAYGKSLSALEQEWLAELDQDIVEVTFDPQELIASVDTISTAYDGLFDNFRGTAEDRETYRSVDQARLALLEGRFEDIQTPLSD